MNRFVFIAPMFNMSASLARMLHSIVGQSYSNWKIILIDDLSSDKEKSEQEKIIKNFKTLINDSNDANEKISVIWNTEKLWEVANVLNGISKCDDDDIICRIDADDWLCDLDALIILNSAYNESQCDTLWTSHRWGFSDKSISAAMPDSADPYSFPWVSSHLKTFRKKLINGVNDINFRGQDGNYIKRAGDQALYLPILNLSAKRVFLPRTVYHYEIKDVPETYQTQDAKFQRDEALFLRHRGFVS
jgi:glycosyltransferase involved in cell wall biosynthesis